MVRPDELDAAIDRPQDVPAAGLAQAPQMFDLLLEALDITVAIRGLWQQNLERPRPPVCTSSTSQIVAKKP